MELLDNNILINAFRPDAPQHLRAKEWLEATLETSRSVRLFPTVEAGFLRIVTNSRIFSPPSSKEEASAFLSTLGNHSCVETVLWTSSIREYWFKLCLDLNLSANDCNDAMLAALALEKGLRLVTFDKGFERFPGLELLLLS